MNTVNKLRQIRKEVEQHFSAETSLNPETYSGGSTGHCVVVSLFVKSIFGGTLVSTKLEPVSHWFNRLTLDDGRLVDVDLTGDQFGHDSVRVASPGELYSDAKERSLSDINEKTLKRYDIFINKNK